MRFSSTLLRGAVLLGALTLVPVPAALAKTEGERTPLHLNTATTAHVSSGSSGILRTIIALVIVVVLIYVVARVLKSVKGDRTRASGEGLEHLATLPLAPNKSLALVRSGSDVVLVGIGEAGVTPIRTYTEAEAIANGLTTLPEPPAEPDPTEPSFTWLETLRRRTVR